MHTKPITFLIRRTPKHSVVAHCLANDSGITLLRITPDAGVPPDITDLDGKEFDSRSSLRHEIKERMRLMSDGDDTQADRQMRYYDRKRASGMVRVEEWVPQGRVHELKALAKTMRDALEE